MAGAIQARAGRAAAGDRPARAVRADSSGAFFTIDVPVVRGDNVLYMVTGIIRPAALVTLTAKQHVHVDGVVSVLASRSTPPSVGHR